MNAAKNTQPVDNNEVDHTPQLSTQGKHDIQKIVYCHA